MDDHDSRDQPVETGERSTSAGPMSGNLYEEMREGYLATREDREELNRDWSAIDDEGWPD